MGVSQVQNIVYHIGSEGQTLDQLAKLYHVDAKAIRKLNFSSKAINPDGSLNPGHDIKLPIDAYDDSALAAFHTLIRGRKHDISGHLEWSALLRRFSSSGSGAASVARGPSEKLMTPDEYIESILMHLGPTDEDFFNPASPPYEHGALTGIVTRLSEHIADTDVRRLAEMADVGYDKSWALHQDCSRPNPNNPVAGFVTGYMFCSQSYIDGLDSITSSPEEAKKYLRQLLERIQSQIKADGLTIPVPQDLPPPTK